MCGIWLAKNDFDNEVRTLQLLGRIPYCLIINLVSSRKQPCHSGSIHTTPSLKQTGNETDKSVDSGRWSRWKDLFYGNVRE